MVLPYKSPRELQCTSSLSYSLLSLINQHINLIKFPVFFFREAYKQHSVQFVWHSTSHGTSILHFSIPCLKIKKKESCVPKDARQSNEALYEWSSMHQKLTTS